jgi:hypothetical protein
MDNTKMGFKYKKLMDISKKNGGVFTTLQAAQCGFSKSHHSDKLKTGVWERVGHGLYRFTDDLELGPIADIGAALLWT